MSIRLCGVPLSTEEQLDCFTLALESLLRFHDLELAHLHFDEWFFSCQRDEAGPLRLAAQTRDFALSLGRFGVELSRWQEQDFASGWSNLCAELHQGRPALIELDTYYLRPYYYPGRPIHTPHIVVLSGYDLEEVFLVDPSPYKAFVGSIPLKGFERAWWAGELDAAAFVWWQLRVPAAILPRTPEMLLEELRRNIGWMLGEEEQGVAGIRKLAGIIEEAGGSAERTVQLLGQCAQLKWVSLARCKHAQFLAHAGKRLGRRALGQIGEEVKGVAQEWMVGRNLALRGCRRQGREMAARLGRRVSGMADQEERLLLRLAGALEEVR